MRYVTMGLKREVSLVILPIDDFTGRVITGSAVRMYTEDGKPSIRKEEGYHVFCDLTAPEIRISAEGPLYQKQVFTVPLGGGVQIRQIRMLPGRCYPIPSGATCLKGRLPAGTRLRLYFPEQKKGYKLLYDYDPENGILRCWHGWDADTTEHTNMIYTINFRSDDSFIIDGEDVYYRVDKF